MAERVIMEISAADMRAAVKLWLEKHVLESGQVHEFVDAEVLSVKQRGAIASKPFVIEFEA